jgi:hypothetical protein
MDLRIALYDTDGHAVIVPIGQAGSHEILNCVDDLELVAEFAKLVGKLRRQQKRSRRRFSIEAQRDDDHSKHF